MEWRAAVRGASWIEAESEEAAWQAVKARWNGLVMQEPDGEEGRHDLHFDLFSPSSILPEITIEEDALEAIREDLEEIREELDLDA